MSLSPTQAGTSAKSANADDTDLHGRWLLGARIVWVIVVLLTLGLFVASIPSYFAYLHILSATPTTVLGGQLARQDVQQLQAVGLSIDFYAWNSVILISIIVIVYSLIGLVLFLRKSENRMALLASFTLVILSIDATSFNVVQTLPSIGNVASMGITLLGSLSISLFFLLFPSGRFVLRWIRWLAIVEVIYWTVNAFIPSSTPPVIGLLGIVLFPIVAGSLVVVQIYRYRRLSSAIERQQTKWVVFGTSLGIGGWLLGTLLLGLAREVFNVNVVIFQPLRRRLQAIIDRRFFRRKYDAARTVAAFSTTLRNEVDLMQLSEHLLTVVQETMQPSHVSLWLPPAKPDRTQQIAWRSTPPVSSDGK